MNFRRITYETESNGKIHMVVIENNNPDGDIWDVGEMLRQLLAGAGFHPENIAELFGDDDGLDKDQEL